MYLSLTHSLSLLSIISPLSCHFPHFPFLPATSDACSLCRLTFYICKNRLALTVPLSFFTILETLVLSRSLYIPHSLCSSTQEDLSISPNVNTSLQQNQYPSQWLLSPSLPRSLASWLSPLPSLHKVALAPAPAFPLPPSPWVPPTRSPTPPSLTAQLARAPAYPSRLQASPSSYPSVFPQAQFNQEPAALPQSP